MQTTVASVQFLCDYTKIDENLIPKTNYVQVIGNQDSGLIIGASRGLMEPLEIGGYYKVGIWSRMSGILM